MKLVLIDDNTKKNQLQQADEVIFLIILNSLFHIGRDII